MVDLTIEGCVVQSGFADGINIQDCANVLVSGNLVDGTADDCIAIGYRASQGGGVANGVVVSNNICIGRNLEGIHTGRGILVLRASNIQVIGNLIKDTQQDGLLITTDSTSVRPSNILVFGNTIRNAAIYSGDALSVFFSSNTNIAFNKIFNPARGNAIELCDWQNLTISNNDVTSNIDAYFRAVHATESSAVQGLSVSSPFNGLKFVNNTVSLLSSGGSTLYNECVRINPGGANRWRHDNTIIAGNTCYQANGNSSSLYIDLDYAGSSGVAKILNNTCAQTRAIGTGGNNLLTPITVNNN